VVQAPGRAKAVKTTLRNIDFLKVAFTDLTPEAGARQASACVGASRAARTAG
jgi:hypothetical protein